MKLRTHQSRRTRRPSSTGSSSSGSAYPLNSENQPVCKRRRISSVVSWRFLSSTLPIVRWTRCSFDGRVRRPQPLQMKVIEVTRFEPTPLRKRKSACCEALGSGDQSVRWRFSSKATLRTTDAFRRKRQPRVEKRIACAQHGGTRGGGDRRDIAPGRCHLDRNTRRRCTVISSWGPSLWGWRWLWHWRSLLQPQRPAAGTAQPVTSTTESTKVCGGIASHLFSASWVTLASTTTAWRRADMLAACQGRPRSSTFGIAGS